MGFILLIKWFAVGATLLFGLYAMVKPKALGALTGLEPSEARGTTEIRAVTGGTFLGLATACILLKSPIAFTMLGICYAAIAVIRAISMVLDKSVSRSNVISLGAEIILAILLVL